jgi:spore coat polysaccharide biosynthesis protein SpsF
VKRVAVIQARMGSSRLPGKVLMDLGGRPMLSRQIERLRRCPALEEIVIATTREAIDDPLVDLAARESLRVCRGSETDVLARYRQAAEECGADLVVRVTGDCPLLDPEAVGAVVTELERNAGVWDYASNIVERTYPRGLDAEAFFMDTLRRMDRLARSPAAREHVTHFLLRERPELFAVGSIKDREDNSDLRWTVDTPEDLRAVRSIFQGMGLDRRPAGYREIVAYARSHPEVAGLNAHIRQKAV